MSSLVSFCKIHQFDCLNMNVFTVARQMQLYITCMGVKDGTQTELGGILTSFGYEFRMKLFTIIYIPPTYSRCKAHPTIH